MIEKTKKCVEGLLFNEDSGHGMDHINRVYHLAMKFAETENCNKQIVALGALLHDVDDYKLFGQKSADNLTNANRILNELQVNIEIKESVLNIIKKMGYSKRLKGIYPKTIEGQIVSDADMCDAIGANGLLRTHKYSLKFGNDFFNKNLWPDVDIIAEKYTKKASDTATCHVFEKLLKLKGLMLTESGKKEAEERHNFMITFLRQVFKEENATEWNEYLDNYLQKLK